MKKCDLLDDLILGKITQEEADDICSMVLSDRSQIIPAHELLGMTKKEWTAYAHGADFKDVAIWRKNGWPDYCIICGKPIISDGFGWLVFKQNGKNHLKHVICPKN